MTSSKQLLMLYKQYSISPSLSLKKEKWMKHYSYIFVALACLSGCAATATGPKYAEHVTQLSAMDPNSARVTVFRTGDYFRNSNASTRLEVDGMTLGECKFKGFNVFDVSGGDHQLVLDTTDVPGDCAIEVELVPGEEYFYEIKPTEFFTLGFVLGVGLGAVAMPANLEIIGLTSYAGVASESAMRECGGLFKIENVDKVYAKEKLIELRFTQHESES